MSQTVAAPRVRYFTLSLRPARGLIHPVDDALADAAGLTRESLSHLDSRNGFGVVCYRLRGDPTTLSTALTDRTDVLVSGTTGDSDGDGGFGCYLRVEGGLDSFETCFFERGLVVDPPIEFVGHDRLRVTVIGTAAMVRAAMKRLPEGVSCSVERLGGRDTDRALVATLTDRQREVIETAFEMGYYDIPRRTTHAEVAAALDRSGSTIDEHLRKAESRLMERLLS